MDENLNPREPGSELPELRPEALIGGEQPAGRRSDSVFPPIQHPVVLALLFAAAAFALMTTLDWFLVRQEFWRPLTMSVISNLIFGVVLFLLMLRLVQYSRKQRRQVLQRLEIIDEMNHHIRNALQVISFNVRPTARNDFEMGEMKQAVERIHWTLREILPKVEPEFTPFEGSGRHKADGGAEPPVE
jgi:ABC-type multidrug transport system fused ATPase/permease subunit